MTPPLLDYAPPLKWHQRRRVQRWIWTAGAIALLPFLVIAVLMGIYAAKEAYLTHQNARLLEACGTYTPPADQVVFEMKDGVIRTFVPAPPLEAYWSPAAAMPTVFLHRLQDEAPSPFFGGPPIVFTELEPFVVGGDARTIRGRTLLCFRSGQASNPSSSASVGYVAGSTKLVMFPQPTDHLRVFAGRNTAAGRFTFDVEYNGHRQTVEGRLAGNCTLLQPGAGESIDPQGGWGAVRFWTPAGASPEQQNQTRDLAASPGDPWFGAPDAKFPAWWLDRPK